MATIRPISRRFEQRATAASGRRTPKAAANRNSPCNVKKTLLFGVTPEPSYDMPRHPPFIVSTSLMTLLQGSLLFGAAMAAGMINSVAGGGTLLTYPSLYWAGYSPLVANATSTVALVPGAWGSMWGYRSELQNTPRRFFALMIPSLIGGIIGAILLRRTPAAVFAALVPFLILFATVLFMAQGTVQRWLRTSDVTHHPVTTRWLVGTAFYQFLVAVYGGYFGAGIGILMLAALGLMGLSNIRVRERFA
ncbi:MAG: sulfite exporter TauE/SafE family protein [Acidobacteriales bacterium]|nr:sulfite exporter TauE/SafE family protein [Terriglobales bacterium]